MTQALETAIEAAWEARADIDSATTGFVREAVEETLAQLDSGALRVAEKRGTDWHVNQWAKKAVLLSFRLNDNSLIDNGPGAGHWLMEESPDATVKLVSGFLEAKNRQARTRAITADSSAALTPTARLSRRPASVRASTSRPSRSVPNQCSAEGARLRSVRLVVCAVSAARLPATTTPRTTSTESPT